MSSHHEARKGFEIKLIASTGAILALVITMAYFGTALRQHGIVLLGPYGMVAVIPTAQTITQGPQKHDPAGLSATACLPKQQGPDPKRFFPERMIWRLNGFKTIGCAPERQTPYFADLSNLRDHLPIRFDRRQIVRSTKKGIANSTVWSPNGSHHAVHLIFEEWKVSLPVNPTGEEQQHQPKSHQVLPTTRTSSPGCELPACREGPGRTHR